METAYIYLALSGMLTVLLWIPYMLARPFVWGLPAFLRNYTEGFPATEPPGEEIVDQGQSHHGQDIWAQRSKRAHLNMVETMPAFVAVVIAAGFLTLQAHLFARPVTNPWPGHLHFAAVVADLAMCPAPAITSTVPMAAMSGPAHGRGVLLHHLGQGLDPGQKTKPIHAEMDCVHRVRSSGGIGIVGGKGWRCRAAGTTDIISHGVVLTLLGLHTLSVPYVRTPVYLVSWAAVLMIGITGLAAAS